MESGKKFVIPEVPKKHHIVGKSSVKSETLRRADLKDLEQGLDSIFSTNFSRGCSKTYVFSATVCATLHALLFITAKVK